MIAVRSCQIMLLGALCLGLCLACAPQGVAPQGAPLPAATSALRYDMPLPPTNAPASPTASGPAPATDVSADAIKLTILHTNDSRGYVDPCG
jgi:2',3'-cyclic-nucleotide 2'-phosphodiesterase (5'-nucleotidase family)